MRRVALLSVLIASPVVAQTPNIVLQCSSGGFQACASVGVSYLRGRLLFNLVGFSSMNLQVLGQQAVTFGPVFPYLTDARFWWNAPPQTYIAGITNGTQYSTCEVNVSCVVATPEPQTLALMGTGLVTLGVAGWRTRRRGRGAGRASP